MASTMEYLQFVLDRLEQLDDISWRTMMGEFIIYYRGKIIGGVYDDRFLIKPTASAQEMLPEAEMVQPYEGAKEMLLVEEGVSGELLSELVEKMYEELPQPKGKKRRKG
ncbi:MAG: TfoX/Sxy family protein [Erysipelotrichaceae bacterium]|nr:TfoX/Sxy family protein [Erysipelotrichaceae bacterium]